MTRTLIALISFAFLLGACVPVPGATSSATPALPAIPQPATPAGPAGAAAASLARELGIAPSGVRVISVESVNWLDSCLGAGGPAELCAAVVTPGYRVVLRAGNSQHVFHTDADGAQVRAAPTPAAPEGPVLTLHREGGLAGFCDDLSVSAAGEVTVRTCKNDQPLSRALTPAEAAELDPWLNELEPFDLDTSDGPVPDSLALKLSFVGHGSRPPTEEAQGAIAQFAQRLLGRTPAQSQAAPSATPAFEVGLAVADSVDVQVLRVSPLSLLVIARGNFPDGCTSIDDTRWQQDGNTFAVTVTTVRPVGAICTQALVPFEETVFVEPDGSLEPGAYTVNVNGVTTQFMLP